MPTNLGSWEGPGLYYPAFQLSDGAWVWKKVDENKELPIAAITIRSKKQFLDIVHNYQPIQN